MLQHPDHYRDLLVLFSVIIALLSCFSSLDLAERLIRDSRGHKFILMLSCLFERACGACTLSGCGRCGRT